MADQIVEWDFDHNTDEALLDHMWRRWDELREQSRFIKTTNVGPDDVWVMTYFDDVHEALRDYELFSNVSVTINEEVGAHRFIPEELDPPEHGKYRQILTPWFAPAAVDAMEGRVRSLCVELIERFAADGRCDVATDFARVFPTTIFMEIMGLPVERSEQLVQWAETMMHTPAEEDPDGAVRMQAAMEVMGMLGQLAAERRAEPRDDLISALIAAEIDGEPMGEQELLQMSILLYMAGLDTVAGELSAFFHHLATHPEDRRRIVDEPAAIPNAVEELLRAYSIVSPGRVVTRDVEWNGCPMKAGDRVLLPTGAANRDPLAFPDATAVDIDRAKNRHVAFGAGPHRCVGSNLARMELVIAMEEWHARIPDYRIDDTEPLRFHSGGVAGFTRLPLVWET
ncbi:MAG: cytochrome P450 [bacterium]|nr:cytochrome P450 [bacterium]MCY3894500.1 cytochrome P450 [Acidimicrobiaceae bacterium]